MPVEGLFPPEFRPGEKHSCLGPTSQIPGRANGSLMFPIHEISSRGFTSERYLNRLMQGAGGAGVLP